MKDFNIKLITAKSEWDFYFNNSFKKSLPQTWEYGDAKSNAEKWDVKRYVIFNNDNFPIGIVQILEKTYFKFFKIGRINRGPIILDSNEENYINHVKHILKILTKKLVKNRYILFQIAPFVDYDRDLYFLLKKLGYSKQSNDPADSGLINIEKSSEEILMNFDGKWRNLLRKGQKLGVEIEIDLGAKKHFNLLVDYYKKQQLEKRFDGTSEEMLNALKNSQNEHYNFILLLAKKPNSKNDIIGMLVCIQYHDTCEYVIGLTNNEGRFYQANSVLLWEALLFSKKLNVKKFDVGGLSKSTPKGIYNFKKGLNPKQYKLIGEFRKYFFNL